MQLIRYNETTAALIEIPFTSVSSSDLQTRLTGATLANGSITVWIKKAGVTSAVAGGAGTFTAVDDTNAPGIRGYRPAAAELVPGVSTFIFSGSGMETREVPVQVVYDDPYAPSYYGSVVAGELLTSVFSTDRTETTANAFKDALVEFLSGPNTGAIKPVGAYTGTGTVGTFTLKSGYTLPATPGIGDKFRIITR